MSSDAGVLYVAIGQNALDAVAMSTEALRLHNGYPYVFLTEACLDHAPRTDWTRKQQSRWLKTRLSAFSPYNLTIYLDADTRPFGCLEPLLQALRDGWDMAICPSRHQGDGKNPPTPGRVLRLARVSDIHHSRYPRK